MLAAATSMQVSREIYVITLQDLLTALDEAIQVLAGGT